MTIQKIEPGPTGRSQTRVRHQDLASNYGNPGADVLSSMTLMTLLEQSCLDALNGLIPPEQMTVGGRMEMDHLAPTPEGFIVTAKAELVEVKGRKLTFRVTAHDGVEEVGRGVHIRFLVNRGDFLDQVAAKESRRKT